MGDVHRDFHAEAKIDRLRGFPLHDESSGRLSRSRVGWPGGLILAKAGRRGKRIIMIPPSRFS
jgi:hypothetical protein